MSATQFFARRGPRLVIMALLAALLSAVAIGGIGPLSQLETQLADRIRIALGEGRSAQNARIALVTIDEATMATLPYRSPIDRGMIAETIRILGDAGARVVGLDILFDQPTEPGKDAALAEAIRAFPGRVVIAWADHRAGMTEAQSAWLDGFVEASGAEPGFVNLLHDPDGVVRRHFAGFDGSTVPGFAAAATGTEPRGSWRIDWLQPESAQASVFQKTPAHVLSVLKANPQILETWYKDRIVLIGADLPQQDRHPTPLSTVLGGDPTAGVEIHAQIAAQLLDGRQVREISAGIAFTYTLILALTAGLAAAARWPYLLRVPALIVLIVLHGASVIGLHGESGAVLPILAPLMAMLLSAGGSMGIDAFLAHKDRRFIRQAFAHYLAPELVDHLTRNPAALRLGGERRQMTFLFTDIAGFTSMSERLEAEDLAALLNAYLDGLSGIVMRHGGVVDKFIGDAVVALFGVPEQRPTHAADAIRCALTIDAFAEEFRARHAETLGITRIGLHTGEAVVGNFGGSQRFDYTAIGDAMNTAARLEGANKAFGTRICLSEACLAAAAHLEPAPPAQRIGDVRLKGKTEALAISALRPDASAETLSEYHAAYALLAGDPPLAEERFSALSSDPVAAFHLERLRRGESGATFELTEK